MTILMLASSYPRHQHDTASTFLRYFAQALHARGHNVHMLAPADREAGSSIEQGVAVHRYAYLPSAWRRLAYGSGMLPNLKQHPWLWLEVPFLLAAMSMHFIRLTRRVRPDIIHAHWVIPQGLMASLCSPFTPAPVIITAHGADAFGFRGGLFAWFKHLALKHADAWTANTGATSSAFGNADGKGLPEPHIIPMGVDVEHFSQGKRESLRTNLDDHCVLLFVGRLVEKKGVTDLIRAFAFLPEEIREKCVLWIAGDGHMRPDLEKETETLGIAGKARFLGNVSQAELPDIYAAADIFVGPSVVDSVGDTEGQGVVFLEASCAGLAIVATRTGGIVDVIQHGENGLLVEPHAPEELAVAITALVRDKTLRSRLGARAHTRAQEYSWKAVAEKFENLYLDQLRMHTDEH